eukprot:XP_001693719.1 predicted protein [Chlamydomonas reinhardtii]
MPGYGDLKAAAAQRRIAVCKPSEQPFAGATWSHALSQANTARSADRKRASGEFAVGLARLASPKQPRSNHSNSYSHSSGQDSPFLTPAAGDPLTSTPRGTGGSVCAGPGGGGGNEAWRAVVEHLGADISAGELLDAASRLSQQHLPRQLGRLQQEATAAAAAVTAAAKLNPNPDSATAPTALLPPVTDPAEAAAAGSWADVAGRPQQPHWESPEPSMEEVEEAGELLERYERDLYRLLAARPLTLFQIRDRLPIPPLLLGRARPSTFLLRRPHLYCQDMKPGERINSRFKANPAAWEHMMADTEMATKDSAPVAAAAEGAGGSGTGAAGTRRGAEGSRESRDEGRTRDDSPPPPPPWNSGRGARQTTGADHHGNDAFARDGVASSTRRYNCVRSQSRGRLSSNRKWSQRLQRCAQAFLLRRCNNVNFEKENFVEPEKKSSCSKMALHKGFAPERKGFSRGCAELERPAVVAHASSNGNGNGKPPGSGSPGDEVFKNLDLKSLNDLPLSKLTETANAVRELSDRMEMMRASVSMLEAKNAKLAREAEVAEAGRSNALRLRDVLLEERDDLAGQLREAQEQLQAATDSMRAREDALEALRQSQQQLQAELRDAAARLQAVDKSTGETGAFSALAAARQELGVLKDENSALAARAEALTTSNRELAAAADTLRAEVAELSAIKDAAAAAGLGLVELAQMSSQVTNLKQQLAAAKDAESGLQRQLAAAQMMFDFVKAVAARELALVEAPGFLGMAVLPESATVYAPKRGEGFPEDYLPFK